MTEATAEVDPVADALSGMTNDSEPTEASRHDEPEVEATATEASPPAPTPDTNGVASVTVTEAEFANSVKEADAILDALLGRIGDITTQDDYLKIMLYGMPGVGKTVFTATAPAWLMVNIEKGGKVLKNHRDLFDPAKCDGLEYRSIYQLEQLLRYLKEGHEAFDKYETIIIDSFSELQKRDLDEIVRVESAKDASRNKFLPIGPDYNINTEHMRVIASDLRDLDRHVIVTCHVKEEKNESTGKVLSRPNLTPKLAGTMAGIFDVVAYMSRTVAQNGQEVRNLQVHPTDVIMAKTRIGGLSPVLENPNFQTLLTAYEKN